MAGPALIPAKIAITQGTRLAAKSGARAASTAATKGAAQAASKGVANAAGKAATQGVARTGTNALGQFGRVATKRFPSQLAKMPNISSSTAQIARKIPLQSKIPDAQTLAKQAHKALDFANKHGITDIAADTGIAYAQQRYPQAAPLTEGLIESARTANNLHYENHHPDMPSSAVKPIVSGIAGSALASTIIQMQELTSRPPPEIQAGTDEHLR